MDSSNRVQQLAATGQATSRVDGLSNDSASAMAAAASLQVLLKEDPLLQQFGLTEASRSGDQVAFAYASTLLQKEEERGDTQQQANLALQDVDRKLILVQSLAVKLSRTSPEAVAGHFLELHGYNNDEEKQGEAEPSSITLQAMRDKADRLHKQADSLETVAKRVESSLTRGLDRMEVSCKKLERVLLLSASLKKILRLQFENEKLQSYDLEDQRDLARAAASVAVLEELLKETSDETIHIVEKLRPQAMESARQVRKAAAALMAQHQNTEKLQALQKLGATLQVYFHLGELPDAVWKAVNDAHTKAEAACRQLWNPVTLSGIQEQAKKAAKGDSKSLSNKLREARTQVVQEWTNGMVEAALQVYHLQTVLLRKTDPVSRRVFLEVVAAGSIPAEYGIRSRDQFSLFTFYWSRLSHSLAGIIVNALQYDKGKLKAEIASLYPAVRAASIELLGRIQDTKGASSSSSNVEDLSVGACGILGGSLALEKDLLSQGNPETGRFDNPGAVSADTWTRPSNSDSPDTSNFTAASGASVSAVFNSVEWEVFKGTQASGNGLYRLEQVFLEKCRERLHEPLQYMFPEHIAVDDDGVALAGAVTTVLLPSKYDIQRFEQNVRQELSLADPREGGGDFSAVAMIADCVVDLIVEFCTRAKNAVSGARENGYLAANTFAMTENLQHDRKVAAIMFTLANYLREAPHTTFVAPYAPATLPQHEEAAKICQKALTPAIDSIDRMVKNLILNPLCRALDRQIASVLAKIHMGIYLETTSDKDIEGQPSFVQTNLSRIFESISKNILVKFPPPYAAVIASTAVAFTIYTYISNVCLVRPLEESARLHITQDLADLELVLEQFMGKISGGASKTLSQIGKGRPYAELRGVRQMLFWTGLESKNTSSPEIAKALLREPWMKDVRPSTVFHYLFSFSPSLLSSPHHAKRMRADEYVSSMLVRLDGSVDEGEDDAWMVTVGCCDDFQQRASTGSIGDGDERVAQLVMTLGQELNRQRRH